MILPASMANTLTVANNTQIENTLLRQQLYTVNREINKAIRKGRFNTQFAYMFQPETVTTLTDAGYTVTSNDYGQVVAW